MVVYVREVSILENLSLDAVLYRHRSHIMLTCPCYIDPLLPHFYNFSKIGVYRGIHFFLIFALKHRLWVLVYVLSK